MVHSGVPLALITCGYQLFKKTIVEFVAICIQYPWYSELLLLDYALVACKGETAQLHVLH